MNNIIPSTVDHMEIKEYLLFLLLTTVQNEA